MANDNCSAVFWIIVIALYPVIFIPMSSVVINKHASVSHWKEGICHFGDARTLYSVDYGDVYSTATVNTYVSLMSFDINSYNSIDKEIIKSNKDYTHTELYTSPINVTQVHDNIYSLYTLYKNIINEHSYTMNTVNVINVKVLPVTIMYPPPPQDLNLKKQIDVNTWISSVSGKNITCLVDTSKMDNLNGLIGVTSNIPIAGWIAGLVIGVLILGFEIFGLCYCLCNSNNSSSGNSLNSRV